MKEKAMVMVVETMAEACKVEAWLEVAWKVGLEPAQSHQRILPRGRQHPDSTLKELFLRNHWPPLVSQASTPGLVGLQRRRY